MERNFNVGDRIHLNLTGYIHDYYTDNTITKYGIVLDEKRPSSFVFPNTIELDNDQLLKNGQLIKEGVNKE